MNSNFIFSPVGEDPVAAVKNGALMAIGADHGRYASGLSGSAKTINLEQAVCCCEKDVYAIPPLDHHHIYQLGRRAIILCVLFDRMIG